MKYMRMMMFWKASNILLSNFARYPNCASLSHDYRKKIWEREKNNGSCSQHQYPSGFSTKVRTNTMVARKLEVLPFNEPHNLLKHIGDTNTT